MIEAIIKTITYFFVEVIFEKLIVNLFRLINLIGLFVMKCVTVSTLSISQLRSHCKDTAIPYFIGLGILLGITLLLIRIIQV